MPDGLRVSYILQGQTNLDLSVHLESELYLWNWAEHKIFSFLRGNFSGLMVLSRATTELELHVLFQ